MDRADVVVGNSTFADSFVGRRRGEMDRQKENGPVFENRPAFNGKGLSGYRERRDGIGEAQGQRLNSLLS